MPDATPPPHTNGNGHDRSLPALSLRPSELIPAPGGSVGDPYLLPPPSADEFHLRDYWEVLLRYRWTVLAFFAAVVASTLFVTLVTVPTYKATTLIEIKAENQ